LTPSAKVGQPFVDYLVSLAQRDDRAPMAALRRSLASPDGFAFGADRYIVQWLPKRPSAWRERCYYLVAGLFATHPHNWSSADRVSSNFGVSFAKCSRDKEEVNESIERRFAGMLNADAEDLPVHLRHAVTLLRANEVPVDWAQLLGDLQQWNSDKRWVQRKWSRGFWRASESEKNDSNQETKHVD
jgi:CRISPR system Cascade subunit CasB